MRLTLADLLRDHWLGYSRENASKLCTAHHRAVRNVLIGNYSLYWALYTE
jgi:hypothetical protein